VTEANLFFDLDSKVLVNWDTSSSNTYTSTEELPTDLIKVKKVVYSSWYTPVTGGPLKVNATIFWDSNLEKQKEETVYEIYYGDTNPDGTVITLTSPSVF